MVVGFSSHLTQLFFPIYNLFHVKIKALNAMGFLEDLSGLF